MGRVAWLRLTRSRQRRVESWRQTQRSFEGRLCSAARRSTAACSASQSTNHSTSYREKKERPRSSERQRKGGSSWRNAPCSKSTRSANLRRGSSSSKTCGLSSLGTRESSKRKRLADSPGKKNYVNNLPRTWTASSKRKIMRKRRKKKKKKS